MRPLVQIVTAFAAGAAVMYWFDPEHGRRRRALLGNRLPRGRRGAAWTGDGGADPSSHQARGDAQLRERIRTRVGRLVSHPRAIEVAVADGVVRLSGHVLAKERDGLLTQVHQMPGVVRLVNAMTAHDTPQGIVRLETRDEDLAPGAPGSWEPVARP